MTKPADRTNTNGIIQRALRWLRLGSEGVVPSDKDGGFVMVSKDNIVR